MNRELLLDAQKFLRYLRDLTGVKAHIAGGLVRDAVLGRPFRDVDLYVDQGEFVSVYREMTGDYPDGHFTEESSDEYMHQSIIYQCEVEPLRVIVRSFPHLFDGHPLNLIGLRNKEDGDGIVSRFNFAICQAWISETASGLSDAFRADAKSKQITLLRTDWGREASMRQYKKLYDKYPWPLKELPPEPVF